MTCEHCLPGEEHNGWFFKREPDGSVRIAAPDSAGPGARQVVTLEPETWAALVESMGREGEAA